MNNKELQGWLSIFSELMNRDNQEIQDFIDEHKDKLNHVTSMWPNKAEVIYHILMVCIESMELRKSLQKWFGQFEGAQVCLHCGKLMWEGYSWGGDTYCSIECIYNAENISLSDIDRELHNPDEIDSECYYTEWG